MSHKLEANTPFLRRIPTILLFLFLFLYMFMLSPGDPQGDPQDPHDISSSKDPWLHSDPWSQGEKCGLWCFCDS